jgi:hypothetical protein
MHQVVDRVWRAGVPYTQPCDHLQQSAFADAENGFHLNNFHNYEPIVLIFLKENSFLLE